MITLKNRYCFAITQELLLLFRECAYSSYMMSSLVNNLWMNWRPMRGLYPQHNESALNNTTYANTLHAVCTSYRIFSLFPTACVSGRIDVTGGTVGWLQLKEETSLSVGVDTCQMMWQAGLWSRCSQLWHFTARVFWRERRLKGCFGTEKTVFFFPLLLFRLSAHCASILFVFLSLLEWVVIYNDVT